MKEEYVKIRLIYYGSVKKPNQMEEYVSVSSNLAEGIKEIKVMLAERYSLKHSYITMINDVPLTRILKEDTERRLLPEDVVKIIPMSSGG